MSILKTIKKNNVLRGICLDVYTIIDKFPGLTVGEIYRRYKAKYPHTDRSRAELAKRVNELMNWGAITATGDTICSVSGRKAQVWKVTGKLPERSPKLENLRSPLKESVTDPRQEALKIAEEVKQIVDKAIPMAEELEKHCSLITSSLKSGLLPLSTLNQMLKEQEVLATKTYLFGGKRKRAKARERADSLYFAISTLEYARDNL